MIRGIERAVDPNNDGNFNDHINVISMSLGNDVGNPDDPLSQAIDSVVNAGVVAVVAMQIFNLVFHGFAGVSTASLLVLLATVRLLPMIAGVVAFSKDSKKVLIIPAVAILGKTEKGATVTVNGEFIAVNQDGEFSYQLVLTEGRNEIEIVASKKLSPKSRTVKVVRLIR